MCSLRRAVLVLGLVVVSGPSFAEFGASASMPPLQSGTTGIPAVARILPGKSTLTKVGNGSSHVRRMPVQP